MKKLLLLFLIAGLTGCATADQPSSVKLLKLNYDKSYPVDIWIESGENQVGAYTVTLEYDAGIVNIKNIIVPTGYNSFPGSPMANQATFTTGKTIITGFYPGKNSLSGRVKIATVTFQAINPGTSPFKTTLQNLYNYSSQPLKGKVILSTDSITVSK
ncbi:MAG: hypothetical protein AAB019_09555 [Planctomycetota bacterium]